MRAQGASAVHGAKAVSVTAEENAVYFMINGTLTRVPNQSLNVVQQRSDTEIPIYYIAPDDDAHSIFLPSFNDPDIPATAITDADGLLTNNYIVTGWSTFIFGGDGWAGFDYEPVVLRSAPLAITPGTIVSPWYEEPGTVTIKKGLYAMNFAADVDITIYGYAYVKRPTLY